MGKLTNIEKLIKATPLPLINYKEGEKQISYSQFSTYLNCPHKWYQKYGLSNYIDKPNISLVFGTSLHNSIQEYLNILYKESGASANKIPIFTNFEKNLINEYKSSKEKNNNQHFSTAEELREHNQDGLEILNFLRKKRGSYFTIKNMVLLGTEFPIIVKLTDKLYFKGSIDVCIYDKDLDKIYIYDLKSSTKSWSDYQKKDKTKTYQLLMYKKFFSELYNFPIENIEVEFLIFKRKIQEHDEYTIPRIQSFKPSSGKNSVLEMSRSFNKFIEDCFDKDGKPILKEYNKNISDFGCKFCVFNNTEFCIK